MSRSWTEATGLLCLAIAFAIGGVSLAAGSESPPGAAHAVDPTADQKKSLPANIHGEDPNAPPAPGGPTAPPPPMSREDRIKTAKRIVEQYPDEAVVCLGPDGTPVDVVLVRSLAPAGKPTREKKQKTCDEVAKDRGVERLTADE